MGATPHRRNARLFWEIERAHLRHTRAKNRIECFGVIEVEITGVSIKTNISRGHRRSKDFAFCIYQRRSTTSESLQAHPLSTSRPQIDSLEKQVVQNIKKKGFLYLGVLFQSFSSSLPTTGSSNTGRNSNQIHRITLEPKSRPLSQSRIIISTRLQHRLDPANLTQQRTRRLL
jgi:hypothetical protein